MFQYSRLKHVYSVNVPIMCHQLLFDRRRVCPQKKMLLFVFMCYIHTAICMIYSLYINSSFRRQPTEIRIGI